jgi:hypothetical protein
MSALRVIGGIVSLGLAALLAFHLAVVFRPLILPILRQVGKEETVYFVVRVAGLTFSGWHILVFESALAVICFMAAVCGIYALTGNTNHG